MRRKRIKYNLTLLILCFLTLIIAWVIDDRIKPESEVLTNSLHYDIIYTINFNEGLL
jgi:hypothetical protein